MNTICSECGHLPDRCTCLGMYSHSAYMKGKLKSMGIENPVTLVASYLANRKPVQLEQPKPVPDQASINKAIAARI